MTSLGINAILQGQDLLRDVDDSADVCVIGSGCGGAAVACSLAERGWRVIVVEQGGYYTAADFDQREVNMLAKIDGGRGLDTSVDGGISLTYGHNVGGASVHYWADSYRTPHDRLALWQTRFGMQGHSPEVLAPHFERVERDLNVHVVSDEGYVNRMNALVRDGAHKLGWRTAPVPQARRGCVRSGFCMQGCAYDAKQSQLVTYIPRAIAAGATLYADTRAERFVSTGRSLSGTIQSLECRVLDRATGKPTANKVRIRARAFVVAAGGYGTPELLLRQGLKERLPHTGEHFFCNPCPMLHALFDEDIIQWRNIPAAFGVEHFRLATVADDGAYVEGGYLLMPNQLHPAMLAATLLLPPMRQHEVMRALPRLGGTIAWIDDADEGKISLEGDRRRVFVPLDGQNGLRIRDAWKKQAQLLFAAGAREVFFGDVHDLRIQSSADVDNVVTRADIRPGRNILAAPHPGGGTRMGADAATSVTGFDHRVHGTDNLYVADPSVLPTPPSVDPSLTILAFSLIAADVLHDRL